MALDAAANFIKVTAFTGYSAGATLVTLLSGQGALLPAVSFNLTWWNATDYVDPADDPNVEIVRVTNIAGDVLTVTRAQESTSATAKNTASKTYQLILAPTAKTITDIGTALRTWKLPTTLTGTINGANTVFTFTGTVQDSNSVVAYLAQQPQLQGVHFTYSFPASVNTITYSTAPDASLSGLGHYVQFQ